MGKKHKSRSQPLNGKGKAKKGIPGGSGGPGSSGGNASPQFAWRRPLDPPIEAIAISGGGVRSCAFATGGLQGFDEWCNPLPDKSDNPWGKVEMLSAVSGGSYAMTGLAYHTKAYLTKRVEGSFELKPARDVPKEEALREGLRAFTDKLQRNFRGLYRVKTLVPVMMGIAAAHFLMYLSWLWLLLLGVTFVENHILELDCSTDTRFYLSVYAFVAFVLVWLWFLYFAKKRETQDRLKALLLILANYTVHNYLMFITSPLYREAYANSNITAANETIANATGSNASGFNTTIAKVLVWEERFTEVSWVVRWHVDVFSLQASTYAWWYLSHLIALIQLFVAARIFCDHITPARMWIKVPSVLVRLYRSVNTPAVILKTLFNFALLVVGYLYFPLYRGVYLLVEYLRGATTTEYAVPLVGILVILTVLFYFFFSALSPREPVLKRATAACLHSCIYVGIGLILQYYGSVFRLMHIKHLYIDRGTAAALVILALIPEYKNSQKMFEYNRDRLSKLYYYDPDQPNPEQLDEAHQKFLNSFHGFEHRSDLPNFVVNTTLNGYVRQFGREDLDRLKEELQPVRDRLPEEERLRVDALLEAEFAETDDPAWSSTFAPYTFSTKPTQYSMQGLVARRPSNDPPTTRPPGSAPLRPKAVRPKAATTTTDADSADTDPLDGTLTIDLQELMRMRGFQIVKFLLEKLAGLDRKLPIHGCLRTRWSDLNLNYSLSSAMALSGAAISTNMGSAGYTALSPVLAFCGVSMGTGVSETEISRRESEYRSIFSVLEPLVAMLAGLSFLVADLLVLASWGPTWFAIFGMLSTVWSIFCALYLGLVEWRKTFPSFKQCQPLQALLLGLAVVGLTTQLLLFGWVCWQWGGSFMNPVEPLRATERPLLFTFLAVLPLVLPITSYIASFLHEWIDTWGYVPLEMKLNFALLGTVRHTVEAPANRMISDGGHFENLGLLEVLHSPKRRMLAFDGEEGGNFSSLRTLIRASGADPGFNQATLAINQALVSMGILRIRFHPLLIRRPVNQHKSRMELLQQGDPHVSHNPDKRDMSDELYNTIHQRARRQFRAQRDPELSEAEIEQRLVHLDNSYLVGQELNSLIVTDGQDTLDQYFSHPYLDHAPFRAFRLKYEYAASDKPHDLPDSHDRVLIVCKKDLAPYEKPEFFEESPYHKSLKLAGLEKMTQYERFVFPFDSTSNQFLPNHTLQAYQRLGYQNVNRALDAFFWASFLPANFGEQEEEESSSEEEGEEEEVEEEVVLSLAVG